MTKPWEIPKMWQGKTVAIFGNGATMTQAVADAARARHYMTIAVNRAVRFAPWADMFVALDPHHPFWSNKADFAGLKVCGVECDIDALYPGMLYEQVTIAPGHIIHIRNNFLAAMRIAAMSGAARIVLLGVDASAYDQAHSDTGFFGFTEGLAQLSDELRSQGIVVDRIEPSHE